MKKFKFKFKAIATLRELEEMRALHAFAASRQKTLEAGEEEKAQAQTVDTLHQSMLQERAHSFSGITQSAALDVLKDTQSKLDLLQGQTSACKAEELKCLQAWQQGKLQVNLFKKLRDVEKQRHWLGVLSNEQKELDDLASQRSKLIHTNESE